MDSDVELVILKDESIESNESAIVPQTQLHRSDASFSSANKAVRLLDEYSTAEYSNKGFRSLIEDDNDLTHLKSERKSQRINEWHKKLQEWCIIMNALQAVVFRSFHPPKHRKENEKIERNRNECFLLLFFGY